MQFSFSDQNAPNSYVPPEALIDGITFLQLNTKSVIIFITRFEPSDYARKLMIRHNMARILSFQMSFATFVLEDCISVISDE